MSVKYEDLQDLHEDSTTPDGPSANRWIPQGILLNKWIPHPLSKLSCSPLTLLIGSLIAIFFLIFIITEVKVASDLAEVRASVKRILSDEVTGSLTSGVQKLLAAYMSHHEESGNETSSECGGDWQRNGSSCYFLAWSSRTWKYAKKECEDRKAHLVVINSEEEMRFLRDFSYTMGSWIGLVSEDGSWKWVDGTSYETSPKFWWEGQPDNWFGHGLEGGEDCAQLVDGDGWTDVHCSLSFPYICEKKFS